MNKTSAICKNCKNEIKMEFDYGGIRTRCIYGEPDTHLILKCSHFSAKPERNDSEKESQEDFYNKDMIGDENRYCSCGKKLGKNKGKGKCKLCLAKETKSLPALFG